MAEAWVGAEYGAELGAKTGAETFSGAKNRTEDEAKYDNGLKLVVRLNLGLLLGLELNCF